ncbi:RES family NAD+ phosphorylase [Rouxiella badensis]|uniref:RES family NAD+ phosphorylase n=1 Tax=Rouxiella TaxID=1565532 RepID=UPI001D0169CC|nr:MULTISPECIES: RES family NAD+ phosphorylase [Rouxiella]MCC3705420.1 RES family NAD+ phosphorylase [Rouxiella badensis]
MAYYNNEEGGHLDEQLNALHGKGRIPVCIRGPMTKQSRWQRESQKSGVHYGKPREEDDMGRYNDASGRTGVCYTADHSVTAIAESYGRQYQKTPNKFSIGEDELSRANICTLETTRETKTVDMDRLLPLLHITVDKVTGDNQTTTRQIVNWASNGKKGFDGVTYRSRHLPVGTCTAWWWNDGADNPLATIEMVPVSKFKDRDTACFPAGWGYNDIEGVEIITETLDFKITPNNPD